MRGVDNFAHAGGFFGGYLAARFLDPLKPERIDHIVIAVICIAATFLAVLCVGRDRAADSDCNSKEKGGSPSTFALLSTTTSYHLPPT